MVAVSEENSSGGGGRDYLLSRLTGAPRPRARLRDAFPLRMEGGEASPATAGTSTWAEEQISMRERSVKRLPIDVL